MTVNTETHGLAFQSDTDGVVLSVLHDDFKIFADTTGGSFKNVVHRASREKWQSFIDYIVAHNAAFNWQIDLDHNDKCLSLFFAGGKKDGELVIVAAPSTSLATRFYHELIEINNQQTNTIRTILKDQSLRERKEKTLDEQLYEELSRLNNELSTAQRELAKKNQELEQLNEVKNQFLGIASHDLRNPLGAILLYSDFLLGEESEHLSEEGLKFVHIIRRSTEFMLALVNDLLDISKIESGTLELNKSEVNLLELVQDNLVPNKVLGGQKAITIGFDHDNNIPTLYIDREKVNQVLNNLIGNAIKFSPKGSKIQVSLHMVYDEIILTVKDEGPGIANSELERIFKPFITSRARTTGGEKTTGLGLTIAKKIIEGHHGHIWVDSIMGQGSTFYISLGIKENTIPRLS